MKKPRSYAVFEDGHEEDLLYYETSKSGNHIFATKSGVYRYWPEEHDLGDMCFTIRSPYFDRLGPTLTDRTSEIKYVVIDERIPYKYEVCGSGAFICGSVLVPPKATDQEIHKLIVEDLEIRYEKE